MKPQLLIEFNGQEIFVDDVTVTTETSTPLLVITGKFYTKENSWYDWLYKRLPFSLVKSDVWIELPVIKAKVHPTRIIYLVRS